MEIISLPFLAFALVVILVYSRLSRPAQNVWLLAASYVFYLTWGWPYAAVLVATTLVNYLLGLRLGQDSLAKSKWLWAGILVNAAPLVALKALVSPYALLTFNTTAALLPIGFSFYTLQAISYLVDVSRGQIAPVRNPVDFALYLAWFPKLLSGPIEKASRFIPQLEKARKVDNARIGSGLGLILVGLLRKLVIADALTAIRPADIFSNPTGYSSLERLVWLVVFAFTLYNDFAGYTSIVRGLSALLGIDLSPNFAQPFFARSFGEFWNRWHITLSTWLRDYIFFPLRRRMLQKRLPSWVALVAPPLLTMLASGYWHGASLSMLSWGGLHGLYQVFEQKFRHSPRTDETALRKVFSALMIFTFVTLAWVPFAAVDFSTALAYWRGFLPAYQFTFPAAAWLNFVAALLFSLGLDWQEFHAGSDVYFLRWPARKQTWVLVAALLVLILFAGGGPNISNFVYQGF